MEVERLPLVLVRQPKGSELTMVLVILVVLQVVLLSDKLEDIEGVAPWVFPTVMLLLAVFCCLSDAIECVQFE